jgi:hypothetical protein
VVGFAIDAADARHFGGHRSSVFLALMVQFKSLNQHRDFD